jgi:hypothetical protein
MEVVSFHSAEVKSMEKKMIPYEKMSKKAKKELDRKKRRDWGGLNPVTRKPENLGAYNRNKERSRRWEEDDARGVILY